MNSWENLGNSSQGLVLKNFSLEIPKNSKNFVDMFSGFSAELVTRNSLELVTRNSLDRVRRISSEWVARNSSDPFLGMGCEKFLGIFTGISWERFLGISEDFPQNCYLGRFGSSIGIQHNAANQKDTQRQFQTKSTKFFQPKLCKKKMYANVKDTIDPLLCLNIQISPVLSRNWRK